MGTELGGDWNLKGRTSIPVSCFLDFAHEKIKKTPGKTKKKDAEVGQRPALFVSVSGD